jgi:hypothetical protein
MSKNSLDFSLQLSLGLVIHTLRARTLKKCDSTDAGDYPTWPLWGCLCEEIRLLHREPLNLLSVTSCQLAKVYALPQQWGQATQDRIILCRRYGVKMLTEIFSNN